MLQARDELGNKYAEAHKKKKKNQGNQGEPAS